jgi:hypothetical protein
MLNAEKIVEMFRKDLELQKQILKDTQNHINKLQNVSPSQYDTMYNLSILINYLENKFSSVDALIQSQNK